MAGLAPGGRNLKHSLFILVDQKAESRMEADLGYNLAGLPLVAYICHLGPVHQDPTPSPNSATTC